MKSELHDLEQHALQGAAKCRTTRSVAVTNMFIGMFVGGLGVSAAGAFALGQPAHAVGFAAGALVLIWLGIHRAFKR